MAPLMNVALPTAHGLYLTAMRSGTGMGVEVNSRGGSFLGKKTSLMFSHRSAQRGLSSNALPRKASSWWPSMEGMPDWGSGCVNTSFAIVAAGSAARYSGAALSSGGWGRSGTRLILPLCVTSGLFVAEFVTPVSRLWPVGCCSSCSQKSYSARDPTPIYNRRPLPFVVRPTSKKCLFGPRKP